MMRVRRDLRRLKPLRERGWGARHSVVPNGLRIVSYKYPALEALGYNTSPLSGLFASQVPAKLASPWNLQSRILRLRSGFRLAAQTPRKTAQLGAVFKLLRTLCMSLKCNDLLTL